MVGVGCRKALEHLFIEFGYQGPDLHDDICCFENRFPNEPILVNYMFNIKYTGNDCAHKKNICISNNEAEILLNQLCEIYKWFLGYYNPYGNYSNNYYCNFGSPCYGSPIYPYNNNSNQWLYAPFDNVVYIVNGWLVNNAGCYCDVHGQATNGMCYRDYDYYNYQAFLHNQMVQSQGQQYNNGYVYPQQYRYP